MKREGQTAIREYVNLYLSGSTESWNRKANFNKQQSCAVCGAHYTVPLLYFVTVLKSWTFDPNCDDESSSAHVCQCIGHRFSNSSFQPLRSGLPWLFLPSLGKDVKLTLCLNTHTHTARQSNYQSQYHPVWISDLPSLTSYLCWRFTDINNWCQQKSSGITGDTSKHLSSPVPERLISRNPTFVNLTVQRCC